MASAAHVVRNCYQGVRQLHSRIGVPCVVHAHGNGSRIKASRKAHGQDRLLVQARRVGVLRTLGQTRCASETSGNVVEKAEEIDPQELLCKLDIRTGKIVSIEEHPEADSLYIEKIDVGEEEPRTIVSGLRPYMTMAEMDGADVVVLCNLKPRNMRGVKSFGMLLCASAKDDGKVEMLQAPEGTPIGERLCFGDFREELPDPDGANKIQKKKTWEKVQPDLHTTADLSAAWKDLLMVSSQGAIKAKTLTNSSIS